MENLLRVRRSRTPLTTTHMGNFEPLPSGNEVEGENRIVIDIATMTSAMV
jgi:hypothetical protein